MTARLSSSPYLRAEGLDVSFGDRRVFAELSVAVAPGQRIGLIGENGVGKSTLLRVLGGAAPEAAVVEGRIRRPARTGLLHQELRYRPDERVADVLERGLAELRTIERELDAAAAALAAAEPGADERYARALDAAERADVWSAAARRDELLAGLGLDTVAAPDDRRIGELSGGQRSRFALAALLLSAPEALLLDEPTNHLDDDAAAYLEERLRAWRGPVLFASHDRELLDRVATGLIDLDPGRAGARSLAAAGAGTRDEVLAAAGGQTFGGGFSDYLTVKAAEHERWAGQHEAEQAELRRLRLAVADTARSVSHGRGPTDNDKFIAKFKRARTDAAVSRRVRNAELRLGELERTQVRKPPAPLEFAGIPSGSQALGEPDGGLLVQAREIAVPGRLTLEALSVGPVARLLVTGANGTGKSTLLGLVAGRIVASAGAIQRRHGLRIGLLEQDVRFADGDATPRRLYERTMGERRAEQVPLADLGLLPPRDLDRPVGVLSVGQQRRLALALVIARPPHLFLLDEPTNHLSLALATELEDALGGYPGAVVIASHDRWLRRRWDGDELRLGGRAAAAVA